MTARPDTWMPVYWGDYARDTGHLNATAHGAYLMLIKHYWCSGSPLRNDDDELWRIACCDSKKEWMKLRQKLIRFFTIDGENLRHKRVDTEIAKATDFMASKGRRGVAGAVKKWGSEPRTDSVTRSQRLAQARAIETHTPEEWNFLLEACGQSCVRCGASGGATKIVKDHIKPIYQGGSDGISNLQPLCARCNSSKGAESIDHRPAHLQAFNACETPTERLRNACKMPIPSPSPSQKEAKQLLLPPSGFENQAGTEAPSAANGWCGWENGKEVIGGFEFDYCWPRVVEAARLDLTRWMGNEIPVRKWMRERIEPETIIRAIQRCASRPDYKPPATLAYFDRPVREAHGRAKP